MTSGMLATLVLDGAVDTLQHLSEHLPRHRHLCQLKHQPPGMPHQMSTYPDELDLDAAQRPVLDRPGQPWLAQEVASALEFVNISDL